MTKPTEIDVDVDDRGAPPFAFFPLTAVADEWIDDHVRSRLQGQWIVGARGIGENPPAPGTLPLTGFVAEYLSADDLIADMTAAGLTVRRGVKYFYVGDPSELGSGHA